MHVSRPEFHQVFSLHPVTVTDVADFLEGAERGDNVLGAHALELLRGGDSRGPDQLGQALTTFLADRHPIFVLTEISLTNWEAQIDRGIGMMMRPPARLFIDAGMERPLAQQMSIRLDHNAGSMAGAFVPAHLVGQFDGMLEERLQRHLRRLREAELDPIANVGLLLQAVAFAKSNGTGLIEATGVVDALDPGTPVVFADRNRLPKDLRTRLEAAAKPPKKPGLLARMFGGRSESSANGTEHRIPPPDDPAV